MPSIVWKRHLTFGLVSIPVKLLRAARRERVRLHYVHKPTVADQGYEPSTENATNLAQEASVGRQRNAEAAPPQAASAPVAPISRVRQALVASGDEQPIRRAEVF